MIFRRYMSRGELSIMIGRYTIRLFKSDVRTKFPDVHFKFYDFVNEVKKGLIIVFLTTLRHYLWFLPALPNELIK